MFDILITIQNNTGKFNSLKSKNKFYRNTRRALTLQKKNKFNSSSLLKCKVVVSRKKQLVRRKSHRLVCPGAPVNTTSYLIDLIEKRDNEQPLCSTTVDFSENNSNNSLKLNSNLIQNIMNNNNNSISAASDSSQGYSMDFSDFDTHGSMFGLINNNYASICAN